MHFLVFLGLSPHGPNIRGNLADLSSTHEAPSGNAPKTASNNSDQTKDFIAMRHFILPTKANLKGFHYH